jgi:hypothetical protein
VDSQAVVVVKVAIEAALLQVEEEAAVEAAVVEAQVEPCGFITLRAAPLRQ